jgi:hypothetical protein
MNKVDQIIKNQQERHFRPKGDEHYFLYGIYLGAMVRTVGSPSRHLCVINNYANHLPIIIAPRTAALKTD